MEDSLPISVSKAWQLTQRNLFVPKVELCNIQNVNGRILAEDVLADRDFPPFNRVAMDGICMRYTDFENGVRSFRLTGIQSAGLVQQTLSDEKAVAIEVMTGACLPKNADTVIRYEDLNIENGFATITIPDIRNGQNVHLQGTDRKANDIIIPKHKKITFAEVGVLATVGLNAVPVLCLPKIAVVSTGDELVEIDQIPLNHQIRKSNVYALQSLLIEQHIQPDLFHLADEKSSMTEQVSEILEGYDVLLLSGAVSKGKYDFLPDVLHELGVLKHFHQVQIRPGKPFWFGTKEQTTVFAFPGNPVSTMVCAKRFFEPWLQMSLFQSVQQKSAVLTEKVQFKPKLQYFLPVSLHQLNGISYATPLVGNGSGDLANLVDADGFMELPAEFEHFEKGVAFQIWTWRSF